MKRLPKIPTRIWSALGPVPVVLVDDLTSKRDGPCLGLWVPEERVIKLRRGLSAKTAWATLKHECIHCWLWDSGFGDLSDKMEERICDALGTAITAEMLHLP